MTQRTIHSGTAPTVVVRAGGNARIEGWNSDRVQAEARNRWSLELRARNDAIEVTAGGSCVVRVPLASTLKVYAGKVVEVRDVKAVTAANAGADLEVSQVQHLSSASAGQNLRIDCGSVIGSDLRFSAGRDIRCQIRDLSNSKLMISDLGGYWEVELGEPVTLIQLTGGGDVTVVSDQMPRQSSPITGNIETPPLEPSESG